MDTKKTLCRQAEIQLWPCLGGILAAAMTVGPACGQTLSFPAQTNCVYDWSGVHYQFTNTLGTAGIANGSLLVLKNGQALYEEYAGSFTANTLRPIASGSKWLSAVVIMSLVDDGVLSLDDPVSKYFPAYYTGIKGTITIREMFSHTSGLPGTETDPVLSDDTITLQQAAQYIATNTLIAPPDTVFCYGGLSMQLAGACAEVASGQNLVQPR
jgi:CubicO group peptidase (beta-lactamase class C family)